MRMRGILDGDYKSYIRMRVQISKEIETSCMMYINYTLHDWV